MFHTLVLHVGGTCILHVCERINVHAPPSTIKIKLLVKNSVLDELFHMGQETLVSPVLTDKQALESCTYYASAGILFLLTLSTDR